MFYKKTQGIKNQPGYKNVTTANYSFSGTKEAKS
jgi:hypothetical protein